nr:MAG TPA: hypothetical protein [Caudoviricetes sp.]
MCNATVLNAWFQRNLRGQTLFCLLRPLSVVHHPIPLRLGGYNIICEQYANTPLPQSFDIFPFSPDDSVRCALRRLALNVFCSQRTLSHEHCPQSIALTYGFCH